MSKNKFNPGDKILVQSEFDGSRFYMVTFGDKRLQDRCTCLGVRQYLGQKKTGEPIYRDQNNCFHVQWARKYFYPNKEVLLCGQEPGELPSFKL